MSKEPDTEEVSVYIGGETAKAYFLTSDGKPSDWFPKSEVHFSYRKGGEARAIIPVWLLEKKGW